MQYDNEAAEHPRNPEIQLLSAVFLFSIGLLFWLLFHFTPPILDLFGSLFKKHKTVLGFIYVVLTMLGGYGLYKFRKLAQAYYGLTECAFATVCCWFSVNHLAGNLPSDWLPLFAAAFLFVRGLVNFYEGKEKEEKAKANK